jgi:hypothetical protein
LRSLKKQRDIALKVKGRREEEVIHSLLDYVDHRVKPGEGITSDMALCQRWLRSVSEMAWWGKPKLMQGIVREGPSGKAAI